MLTRLIDTITETVPTYLIAYETKFGVDWTEMDPVQIEAPSPDAAAYRFHTIYGHCFGDTTPYRITSNTLKGA